MKDYNQAFWDAIDSLISDSEIVVDRPKGSAHPKYAVFIYPVDYGYLKNTSSMDGSGIDIWIGAKSKLQADAIVVIVDLLKRDSEIKILYGCTEHDIMQIMDFHNRTSGMKGILIRRETGLDKSKENERIETTDLILKKAVYDDWKDMYENVWSHSESARYMHWNITTSAEEAKNRILDIIEYQKSHSAWLIYEKMTEKAIGFAGVEETEPGIWRETGICLGPDYTGQGLGKQVLRCLIDYCRENLGVSEFWYSCKEKNIASKALAESVGMTMQRIAKETDERDGSEYLSIKYNLKL